MQKTLAFTLVSLVFFSSSSKAEEVNAASAVPVLELVSNFDIPPALMAGSTARDLRWKSDNTLLIAFGSAGAAEFELGEELTLKSEVFPPRNRDGAKTIKNLWNLAISSDAILGFNSTGDVAWQAVGSESETQVKPLRGFLEAMDISGDRVVLLGQPGWPEFEKSGWSFLWTASIGSGLTDWRALGDLKLTSSKEANPLMNRMLGSLRILPNGSFVVAPVVRPGVFHYESSGKLKESWTYAEIEATLLRALGHDVRAEAIDHEGAFSTNDVAPDADSVNAELGRRRLIVEDVLPAGKEPAVVVRYHSGKSTGFYLGVLSSEPAWYQLPLREHPASVRVRSDSLQRKHKLALLVSDRGKPSAETKGQIYILELP